MSVTSDLMRKVSDDVGKTIMRTLMLTPHTGAILLSATATAIAMFGAELHAMAGGPKSAGPQTDAMILAALLAARGSDRDGVEDAYKDFEVLKAAGRITPGGFIPTIDQYIEEDLT